MFLKAVDSNVFSNMINDLNNLMKGMVRDGAAYKSCAILLRAITTYAALRQSIQHSSHDKPPTCQELIEAIELLLRLENFIFSYRDGRCLGNGFNKWYTTHIDQILKDIGMICQHYNDIKTIADDSMPAAQVYLRNRVNRHEPTASTTSSSSSAAAAAASPSLSPSASSAAPHPLIAPPPSTSWLTYANSALIFASVGTGLFVLAAAWHLYTRQPPKRTGVGGILVSSTKFASPIVGTLIGSGVSMFIEAARPHFSQLSLAEAEMLRDARVLEEYLQKHEREYTVAPSPTP